MNNPEEIYGRINDAMERSGRKDRVYFVAVSKTRTVSEMQEAEKFSCIDFFGENRVQEAEAKRRDWRDSRLAWRLIGHLQANKARKALELFDSIDSVDSVELAVRLDRIAGELGKVMPVLIEVNTSGEASKSGIEPEKLHELTDRVVELPNLRLDGLMTVGPLTENEREVASAFACLRELLAEAKERTALELPLLSMGMSSDFELAIREGSTMVRIGTLLFGERDYSKH